MGLQLGDCHMEEQDGVLLERWQHHRDADAFTELVRRYSDMVYATCVRVLRDAAQAEEVAQDCFVELMRSRQRVRVSLGAWLHKLAVHRTADRVKIESRRRRRESAYQASMPDAAT